MSHQMMTILSVVVPLLFAFAFGSCIGSLINVLVYRMPLGLNVVSPASRCPSCSHILTWRENIPVFGWLLLRGKCRFCKSPISPEYPIVEAIVGMVFVLFYLLWYIVPDRGGEWLGINFSAVKPEWAMNGFMQSWPVFITLLVLVSSLIAMTIIDARTFTIPLELAWTPTILALIAHPACAAVLELRNRTWRYTADGEVWAIATPGVYGWPVLCASIGACVGLLIALGLLASGLIKRSFADYDEWEAKAMAEAGLNPSGPGSEDSPATPEPASKPAANNEHDGPIEQPADSEATTPPSQAEAAPQPQIRRAIPWKSMLLVPLATLICGLLGALLMPTLAGGPAALGAAAGAMLGIVLVGPVLRLGGKTPAEPDEASDSSPAEFWIQYPHARREVIREIAFLAPCILLAIVGWMVGSRIGAPWSVDPITFELVGSTRIPLWLNVLGGVLLGYLVGGGMIWGIRIFGTLAFGKEAMGLGDVHLLAAVGACLGWIDAVLAFFVAPFLALYMVLVQAAWTGGGRRAMPYGPYLAIATFAVILGKPGLELILTAVFGTPEPLDLP